MKKHLIWIPEVFFIISFLLLGFNPFAISLIMILLVQFFLKKRALGIAISCLIILINFYLVLALLSEFREFPTFNSDAKMLIIGGGLYLGLNLTMATIMLFKYQKG